MGAVMSKLTIKGRGAIGGIAVGEALVFPKSIQDGLVDDQTGTIIEKGHSQKGTYFGKNFGSALQ